MQGLFNKIEKEGKAFEPYEYLSAVFSCFPQFAEKDPKFNSYRQQDADECFQLILNEIAPLLDMDLNGQKTNVISHLFQVDLKTKFENKEDKEDVSDERMENTNKISCIIDNQMNPVNELSDGIKVGFEDEVEKNSTKYNKNCLFTKKAQMTNLPNYLIVQKIRFVWREADESSKEGRKAKILRQVTFPKTLDVYEHCEDALKKKIDPIRVRIAEKNEEEKQRAKDKFEEYKKKHSGNEEDTFKLYKKFKQIENENEVEKHDSDLWGDLSVGDDSGNYELVGVITHKGRSSDSGHYVSWVQHKGDKWLKFDDDFVSEVGIDDVLFLKGGGDWHMAYYLVFRKLKLRE